MAFTTPTDDLNNSQTSGHGSEDSYQEHEGNVLTTTHDEQALDHLLDNLPVEKALSYLFLQIQRRQASIPPFLNRQPSARSQLAALGKLAALDAPPSPATTPLSINQAPQTPSPRIRERHEQDERDENGGLGISLEMAAPSGSPSDDGDEHDSLPTDELHTHVSAQEEALPDALASGPANSTVVNEGSVTGLSLIREDGLGHPHEPAMDETAGPAEASHGTARDLASKALDMVRTVYVGEREDVSPPSNPNADSEPSAKSRQRRRKRISDSSTLESESERRRKRSTADRNQEVLLAKAYQMSSAIATVHDIIFLQERFALLRRAIATRHDYVDDTDQQELPQQDLDRRPGLKRWWAGLGIHEKGERWEKCIQRAFAGLFYGQYVHDRDAFDDGEEKGNLPHPIEMYVDVCSPETVIPDGEAASKQALTARAQAKRRFQNEVQKKKLWSMMRKRYNIAVFFVLPTALQEDHVRRLRETNLELLLDRIDEQYPSLRDDLQGLSHHLSYFIDYDRLPVQKLRFEELSRSELESECFKSLSLSDLFKPHEPPAANAPSESPSTSEGSYEDGDRALSEEVSVDTSPPQVPSQLASPSLSSPRDIDEPLTPRTEVDPGTVTLSDNFDTATDAPGFTPAGFLSPLENTYAPSSTDEGEFDHYHKQIMASRDPNNDFFFTDNSPSWQY